MKNYLYLLACVCCLTAASPSLAFQEKPTAAKETSQFLSIGSEAPSLSISDWISTGDFEEVTELKPGKVYVVEFWATWCRPCIASMPHISELQAKYEGQGVQVISVSDEDLVKVEAFLKRKVGKTKQTYGELTSNYCLTTDPDGSTKKDYMTAAGELTLPVAFIVGKTGKIEWIGQPIDIDQPLEQVVAGKWDRNAAKKEREGDGVKVIAGKTAETMELVTKKVRVNDMDAVKKILDKAIAINTGKDKNFLKEKKFQVLAKAGVAGSDELFATYAMEAVDHDHKAELAYSVAKLTLIGVKLSDSTIDEGRRLIDEAVAEENDDAILLDIQSHLAYFQGNLDEAIEIRKRSIEACTPKLARAKKTFEKHLNQMETEKASMAKKAESKAEGDKPATADEKMQDKKEKATAE